MDINHGGHQIDFRKGLVYISPPRMQASNEDRQIFLEKDSINNYRQKLIAELKNVDSDNKFEIMFGGAVGISICPIEWNKSQVISYLTDSGISQRQPLVSSGSSRDSALRFV